MDKTQRDLVGGHNQMKLQRDLNLSLTNGAALRLEDKDNNNLQDDININVASIEDCDALAKLAYNLYKMSQEDHIVIDRKRNEVIRTDAVTQQMTIYRCMDPLGMGMRTKTTATQKRAPAAATVSNPAKKLALSEPTETCTQRTRSGRLVRANPVSCTAVSTALPVLEDLRDQDYKAAAVGPTTAAAVTPMATTRSVPANAICPGCHKIFLGRRLQRHFVKFPQHMETASAPALNPAPVAPTPAVLAPTLFGLFTAQLQRHSHLSEEQRADLFLNELTDFVEQLQLRSTRLIRNTSGLHFVNARISRVLGIPEGQYALDMSAMESPQAPPAPTPEPEQPLLSRTRNLVDYTAGLSMSLDDTLTDEAAQRLNLSVGGKLLPPSEESLLRNVGDDLMQPPVTAVVVTPLPATVVGHGYDHASDNAVEALSMKETPSNAAILDLQVDFFQFQQN